MIWLWLYLAGYALAVVPTARWFLAAMPNLSGPEPFEVAICVFLGLLIAAFWPLLIPGYFVYRALVDGMRREEPK